jgi:hypothetical protein
MDSASWPCTLSQFPHSATVFERLDNSPHQPRFPDLMPCNRYVFPELKIRLKSHHFVSKEEIQECSGRFQSYQKRMPKMHSAVVGLLQQVYMCRRAVLGG